MTMTNILENVKIESNGVVLIRQLTTDNQYHRLSFCPGDDISSQPKEIQDICNAAWTDEIKAKYSASKAAQHKIGGA